MKFGRVMAIALLWICVFSIAAEAQLRWGHPKPPRAGACFYREPSFSGYFFCMRAGEQEPALPSGFNDKISSIRVFGGAGARVFNGANFAAPTAVFFSDVVDLRAVSLVEDPRRNWNDRISSIAVFFRRDDRWERPHR
ncbi:MAG: peptidase inhibitor family I36 protein [Candidatus Korobacteraceae bacterium]